MYCKKIIRYSLPVSCLLSAQSVFAKCGGVDYSWGADALALMHDYVVTMMLYVLYLTYAIAALVTIYASLQIFIKMNAGEEGIVKEILMVCGSLYVHDWSLYRVPSFLRLSSLKNTHLRREYHNV